MGNYEVKNISKRLSFYLSIGRGSKNEKIYAFNARVFYHHGLDEFFNGAKR